MTLAPLSANINSGLPHGRTRRKAAESKTCKRGRRIAADKKDSLAIKRKLKTSIDPFNSDAKRWH